MEAAGKIDDNEIYLIEEQDEKPTSYVTIETWNSDSAAESSYVLDNLVINQIKDQATYDAMKAAGKIDDNEIYLIKGESATKVSVEPALTTGVEVATIIVDETPYKIYVPEASKIEVTRHTTAGEKIATITLDGVSEDIYAPEGYTLPAATENALGGVKSGGDIEIDANGNVTVNDKLSLSTTEQ